MDKILQSNEIEDKRGAKETLAYLVRMGCVAEMATTPTMYSITSFGRYELLRHDRNEIERREEKSKEGTLLVHR